MRRNTAGCLVPAFSPPPFFFFFSKSSFFLAPGVGGKREWSRGRFRLSLLFLPLFSFLLSFFSPFPLPRSRFGIIFGEIGERPGMLETAIAIHIPLSLSFFFFFPRFFPSPPPGSPTFEGLRARKGDAARRCTYGRLKAVPPLPPPSLPSPSLPPFLAISTTTGRRFGSIPPFFFFPPLLFFSHPPLSSTLE